MKLIHCSDRILKLRLFYHDQLSRIAKFVQYFEMKDQNNRPIYDLFFASNHPLGFIKMKEAMWTVDPEGNFSFSDATDHEQLILLETDHSPILAKNIMSRFKGEKNVNGKELREYAEYETFYLNKHKTGALKLLEIQGQMSVDPRKTDGLKRRQGTFPDNIIVSFE